MHDSFIFRAKACVTSPPQPVQGLIVICRPSSQGTDLKNQSAAPLVCGRLNEEIFPFYWHLSGSAPMRTHLDRGHSLMPQGMSLKLVPF